MTTSPSAKCARCGHSELWHQRLGTTACHANEFRLIGTSNQCPCWEFVAPS